MSITINWVLSLVHVKFERNLRKISLNLVLKSALNCQIDEQFCFQTPLTPKRLLKRFFEKRILKILAKFNWANFLILVLFPNFFEIPVQEEITRKIVRFSNTQISTPNYLKIAFKDLHHIIKIYKFYR